MPAPALIPVGEAGRGDQGAAEAEPGRLGQAAGQLRDRADLAAQADLADGDQVGRDLPVAGGRGQGQADGQVGARAR